MHQPCVAKVCCCSTNRPVPTEGRGGSADGRISDRDSLFTREAQAGPCHRANECRLQCHRANECRLIGISRNRQPCPQICQESTTVSTYLPQICHNRAYAKQFELRYTQGYANPPEELLVDISVDKLLLQFSRLRSWLQSLERAPYGHEFYAPKPLLVNAVNTTDNRPVRVSADKIGTIQWPRRYIPQLPTMASTPRCGQVEFLQVEKRGTS